MANQPLAGRVALVTGAGSPIGMGRAMSLAMVRAGARVAMVDVNRDSLEQTANAAQEVGGDGCVLPVVADVSNPGDAKKAVERTIAEFGGLHILVNNAGINQRHAGVIGDAFANFWDTPAEAWNRVVGVNFSGPFFMASAAVKHFLEQGWGRIIGVTTSLDTMIRKQMSPYGPSKAGHEALMAIMAQDLEGTGVTVNVLVPGGPVNTNLLPPDTTFDRAALIQPDVMEKPIVWLASEESAGISGYRFIAYHWDSSLPRDEAIKKAGAPIAWSQLGAQTIWHR